MKDEKFETYGDADKEHPVEIFGHQVVRIKNIRVGKVTEQVIGGKGMLRTKNVRR
jgi:hypothetical protein